VDLKGQLHVRATLPLGNEHLMPIEYDLSGHFGGEKTPFTMLAIEPRAVKRRA